MKALAEFERLARALEGICLLGCLPGSPAERAGLRYGDIVLEVNGQRVSDLEGYLEAIRQRCSPMRVLFSREGSERQVEFALGAEAGPLDPLTLAQGILAAGQRLGAEVASRPFSSEPAGRAKLPS